MVAGIIFTQAKVDGLVTGMVIKRLQWALEKLLETNKRIVDWMDSLDECMKKFMSLLIVLIQQLSRRR